MAEVGIAELLEAGVHFGHQTRRWNPKMRRFIYGERNGIYIIDLLKTAALLKQAQEFAGTLAHRGGVVLFVGTKKQARDTIRDVAESAGMPYVNHRWLGGLLTNFQTINQRIRRLHDLERYETEGQLALLPTRERMSAQADLLKLRANLGGVKNMQRVPDAMFVIDLKTELIAVREAQRLRIPIIGLVDTNCDPDGIDFVIPGNDDAIRSCALITQAIGDVVADGHVGVPRRGAACPRRSRRACPPRGRGTRPPRSRGAGQARGGRAGQARSRRARRARGRRGAGGRRCRCRSAARDPATAANGPAARRPRNRPPLPSRKRRQRSRRRRHHRPLPRPKVKLQRRHRPHPSRRPRLSQSLPQHPRPSHRVSPSPLQQRRLSSHRRLSPSRRWMRSPRLSLPLRHNLRLSPRAP